MSFERSTGTSREYGWLPDIKKVRKILQPAQIATLFTVPVQLVAGVPNKVILPEFLHVVKQAGTGWTTTGSGQLAVSWTPAGSGPYAFALFDQATTTTFFGANQNTWIAANASGSANAANKGPCGVLVVGNAVLGTAVNLSLGTADISGGTGSLTVTLFYRIWGIDKP